MNANSADPARPTRRARRARGLDAIVVGERDAAGLLGCPQPTLRARVARREVPFRRYGNRLIFLRSELEEFVRRLGGCDVVEALRNVAGLD